jgi:hypothetical protein
VIRHRSAPTRSIEDEISPIVFDLKGRSMKYLVPPIVIPVLLFIGIVAYALLRPPLDAGHSVAPVSIAQPR